MLSNSLLIQEVNNIKLLNNIVDLITHLSFGTGRGKISSLPRKHMEKQFVYIISPLKNGLSLIAESYSYYNPGVVPKIEYQSLNYYSIMESHINDVSNRSIKEFPLKLKIIERCLIKIPQILFTYFCSLYKIHGQVVITKLINEIASSIDHNFIHNKWAEYSNRIGFAFKESGYQGENGYFFKYTFPIDSCLTILDNDYQIKYKKTFEEKLKAYYNDSNWYTQFD